MGVALTKELLTSSGLQGMGRELGLTSPRWGDGPHLTPVGQLPSPRRSSSSFAPAGQGEQHVQRPCGVRKHEKLKALTRLRDLGGIRSQGILFDFAPRTVQ